MVVTKRYARSPRPPVISGPDGIEDCRAIILTLWVAGSFLRRGGKAFITGL